jgi:hypothetical protein
VRVHDYLCTLSRNPYTSGSSSEVHEICESLDAIEKYEFQGGNMVYEIAVVGAG